MLMNLTLAICIYNASRYIEETLQSVLAQQMQEFYLLLIDDCSTDDSIKRIEQFFLDHPRQHELVCFEENRGLAFGRYYAEHNVHTEYLMFLDADDVLYPRAIATLYNKIVSDVDLIGVGCYLEYIDENSQRIGGGIFLGETSKDSFYRKARLNKLIFMQSTAIYRRETALSIGGHAINGFPSGKPRFQDYCEDLDFWTRMSDLYTEGKAIVVVPEVLCRYRKSSGLSSNAFYMMVKMRYVKTNLLRRRSGKTELTFIEFYNSLSDTEVTQLKHDAIAADCLRNGVLLLRQFRVLSGIWLILESIYYCPDYWIDKLKHNTRIFRRE
ncbi:MAG: glycosyltransferase [Prevotellaceae bacterium]|nr:glycosyltransferase [Prevotellaceae bacterium]